MSGKRSSILFLAVKNLATARVLGLFEVDLKRVVPNRFTKVIFALFALVRVREVAWTAVSTILCIVFK